MTLEELKQKLIKEIPEFTWWIYSEDNDKTIKGPSYVSAILDKDLTEKSLNIFPKKDKFFFWDKTQYIQKEIKFSSCMPDLRSAIFTWLCSELANCKSEALFFEETVNKFLNNKKS